MHNVIRSMTTQHGTNGTPGNPFLYILCPSVSSPSRTSILNEQNAVRHRTPNWINAESNNRTPFGPKDWNWQGISKETPTLPKILQLVGHKTIQIGKAYFGPIGSKAENPEHIGFDVSITGSAIGPRKLLRRIRIRTHQRTKRACCARTGKVSRHQSLPKRRSDLRSKRAD